MEVTILGCGSSLGVPKINCKCFVCNSPHIKNKRGRASILITSAQGKNILVDTSPDLRYQSLHNNITNIDSIIYTHDHADHVAGIDEIRGFLKPKETIDAYIDDMTFSSISTRYPYIFKTSDPIYPPILKRKQLNNTQFIHGIEVISFDQTHGNIISKGLRFCDIAYSTDLNEISEQSLEKLQNLKVWIIDCLRYSFAPTHLYYEKTLELIEKVQPEKAILTHMGHEIEYEEILKITPANVTPAFDGMKIKI
ncbi:MAG: phosphoribosyl 1,2-cyclic phosphate phosphodiesterase [Candidatus Midichloriaceae bacterium]|jgi:phosphoribosyl 1,2-cyclic phosphate phosphodiesterase